MTTALLLATCLVNAGEADEAPDAEFLEYLGMLENGDDDWTLFESEPFAGDNGADGKLDGIEDDERQIDPAPPGEASTETDDEG